MRYVLLACGVLSGAALADINVWQKPEVNHLLQVVADSRCMFERNGDKVSGEEAAEHMLKKYTHFKQEIRTTEDFIRLAASKSETSGKPYRVHCPGMPVTPSADFLRNELGKFRAGVPARKP